MKALRALILILLTSSAFAADPVAAYNSGELQLLLRKLTNTGSALYVGAHPDDENTAVLSWLESERLVRAAYLSLTRGDGGQNILGTEKGPLLGAIRTQELLAARRIDGAEQFFTRAVDYGFSKSGEEAHRIWDKEAVLGDVVRVIRTFRPDLIITRFPSNGEGGHGQHTSSAILAREAFRAAADPTRFPEQLGQLKPWQAKRIFWNSWTPAQPDSKVDVSKYVKADVGSYNPLLGRSYAEIAGISRSMHRSQGDGTPQRRGTLVNYFELWDGDHASTDLFEGVDLTWKRVPNGEKVGALLEKAAAAFNPSSPAAVVPLLLDARRELQQLPEDPIVALKRRELDEAIRATAGLWFDATTTSWSGTAGSTVAVKTNIVNRGAAPLTLLEVRTPNAAPVTTARELSPNTMVQNELNHAIPKDAANTGIYYLRGGVTGRFLYPAGEARAEAPPSIPVTFVVGAGDQRIEYTIPAMYKWTDRILGDQYRPFEVVPPVSLRFSEEALLFPTAANEAIRVTVHAEQDGVNGILRLKLPPGWGSKPEAERIELPKKGSSRIVSFAVAPTSQPSQGTATAEFLMDGQTLSSDVLTIDYEHIPVQTAIVPAEVKLVRENVKISGKRVGYVMGSGDDVAVALRQMGFDVALLEDDDLASGDLSHYDTIVVGVRAYNVRDALKRSQRRLLDYVQSGGRLVVQYQTVNETLVDFAPYPLALSRDRVTDETAEVKVLTAGHPLLTTPNAITVRDFEGWVQERGLSFARTYDPKYEALLASHDEGENDLPGGMLVASYGKGTFIYTGYAFFRQLPAGVPGAYRLFANVVSPSP